VDAAMMILPVSGKQFSGDPAVVEVHTSTTAGVLQAELAADPADEIFGIDAELGEQAFVFVGVNLLGQAPTVPCRPGRGPRET